MIILLFFWYSDIYECIEISDLLPSYLVSYALVLPFVLLTFCFVVKDKEVPAPEDVEAVVEMEQYNKKRHLNVVFIGHVGRSICFTIFPK